MYLYIHEFVANLDHNQPNNHFIPYKERNTTIQLTDSNVQLKIAYELQEFDLNYYNDMHIR